MTYGSPESDLARSLYSAILCDLAPVEYEETRWDAREKKRVQTGEKKTRRPYDQEVEVRMFSQTWGSTALGFGGIGGQAMTAAYTVVVYGPIGDAVVYFAGRKAYHIHRPNDVFASDVSAANLCEVGQASRYRR